MTSSSKTLPPSGIVAATIRSQPVPETTSSAKCGPTIVELFGLPGVGKTTLTAAVQGSDRLTRTALTAAWNRLPLRKKSIFLLRSLAHLQCVGSAARFAFHTRLTSAESLLRLVRLIAKTHWIRSHRSKMLLDESFLQEIWSICIASGKSDPDQASLAQFIRCQYAGLETRIVFVEADESIVSQRISGRSHGRSRLDGLTAAEVQARLAQAQRLPHAIIAAATAAGLTVDWFDGHDPVEANADRLRKLTMTTTCEQGSD